MLSRVANSIYWMSRYIERAENIARFVDVNLHLILDTPINGQEQWEPLVYDYRRPKVLKKGTKSLQEKM